jgi:hypothetical protein
MNKTPESPDYCRGYADGYRAGRDNALKSLVEMARIHDGRSARVILATQEQIDLFKGKRKAEQEAQNE